MNLFESKDIELKRLQGLTLDQQLNNPNPKRNSRLQGLLDRQINNPIRDLSPKDKTLVDDPFRYSGPTHEAQIAEDEEAFCHEEAPTATFSVSTGSGAFAGESLPEHRNSGTFDEELLLLFFDSMDVNGDGEVTLTPLSD